MTFLYTLVLPRKTFIDSNKMKFVVTCLLFILFWVNSSLIPQPKGQGVFGVAIGLQSTGQLVTFISYLKTDLGIKYKRTLLEDEFVNYASGYWPSIYNPQKENLFERESLACGVIFDSSTWKEYPYCSPVDSLWKIRYNGNPFQQNTAEGWSNGAYRPSQKQEQYLYSEFGVKNIDRGFFVDTSLWKLLRNCNDPNWIQYYRNLP